MEEFEWDDQKNLVNRAKHGIDFADAVQVFFDDRRMERIDGRADYGEERCQVIGMAHDRVLFVVYTERGEATIRIISARRATKAERALYERGGW